MRSTNESWFANCDSCKLNLYCDVQKNKASLSCSNNNCSSYLITAKREREREREKTLDPNETQ